MERGLGADPPVSMQRDVQGRAVIFCARERQMCTCCAMVKPSLDPCIQAASAGGGPERGERRGELRTVRTKQLDVGEVIKLHRHKAPLARSAMHQRRLLQPSLCSSWRSTRQVPTLAAQPIWALPASGLSKYRLSILETKGRYAGCNLAAGPVRTQAA